MIDDPEEESVDNPLAERPSLQDVLDWKNLLIGERETLDSAQEAEKDVYFQRYDQLGSKNATAVKTGSAPSDADSAVDTLVPVDIQVKVTPARAGRKKYTDQAELLSRFGQALIKSWRKKKDPIRRVGNDQVLQRIGFVRVLFDDTRWSELPSSPLSDQEDESGDSERVSWEVRHRSKNPIILERRDPRYVWFRDNEEGDMLVVVEHYPTTVLEARTAFAEYPEAKRQIGLNRRPNEIVWVSDVWVGPWRCILVDERPILPDEVMEHGYAEIPYRYAGFRELPFSEADERFRGMLTNAADLYPMESQVLGMVVELLKWNAWRTFKGWTVDGRVLDISPGQYVEVDQRKGEYLELMSGEAFPPELLQVTSVFDSYIQRNGVSQGPSTADGSRSGQMIWAIQAIRQMKIESARQALLELVEGCLRLACMIVEYKMRGQSMTIPIPGKDREGNARGEVTISAKDIDGYWDGWDISFGKRLDPAMLEQAKALSALAANNWMPLKVSWEMSGLAETPQQWEDDLYLQATDRLPFMLQLAGLERVVGYFGPESWQAQVMKQNIQQSLMQPGTAPGGVPGGAPGMGGGGTMQPPSMVGPTAPHGMQPGNPSRVVGKTRGSRTPGGGMGGPAPQGA